jgi:hypothetical protein
MLSILTCESNLNIEAVGDLSLQYTQNGVTYGASYGIAQVRYLPGRPDPLWLMNPYNNLAYARQLFLRSGVTPWTCSHKTNYNPSQINQF